MAESEPNNRPRTADVVGLDDGSTEVSGTTRAGDRDLGRRAVSPAVATDVHGLGAVLYAMLTGRAPFQGDSAVEALDRVRSHEPEPPSRVGRTVDRDLETIGLKCLAKGPDRRYGSAPDVAEDLERRLRGEPIAARRVGRREVSLLNLRGFAGAIQPADQKIVIVGDAVTSGGVTNAALGRLTTSGSLDATFD